VNSNSKCNIKSRCGQHKTCKYCAHWRQKQIADRAIAIFGKMTKITWYRITPDSIDFKTFNRIRDSLKYQLNGRTALWTIEQGTLKGKLHANILTTESNLKPFKNCDTWKSEPTKDIRKIAAYISKKEQYPEVEAYSGRTFGTMNSLKAIIQSPKMPAIVSAATLEPSNRRETINPTKYHKTKPKSGSQTRTNAEYREIALNHLPKIRQQMAASEREKPFV
jgi:hypothetical protein